MFSFHFLFVLSVCVGAAILSPASAAGSYETCICKEVTSPRLGKVSAFGSFQNITTKFFDFLAHLHWMITLTSFHTLPSLVPAHSATRLPIPKQVPAILASVGRDMSVTSPKTTNPITLPVVFSARRFSSSVALFHVKTTIQVLLNMEVMEVATAKR